MDDLSESIPEILDRLVGKLNAEADACADSRTMKSIPAFEEVCNWVADKIDRAVRYEKQPEYSVHEIGHGILFASRYLIEVIDDMEDK